MTNLLKYQFLKTHVKENRLSYLLGFIVFILILNEAQGRGDFAIFTAASQDLFEGKNIYYIAYNEWYHYYYSVLFAVLIYPFTFLPLYLAKVMWLLANVFFVFRIWKIISAWLPVSMLSNKNQKLFTLLSFVFIFRFLLNNFHLAQMTVFILYLSLEGLKFIQEGKSLKGAALIALGIDIKLLPLFFIAYLIYRKEWKATLYILGFILIFLLLPILFIGVEQNTFLLTERWHLLNPTNKEHIFDTAERSFHSLTTFLTVLLVQNCGDEHALPIKRNIADIPAEQLTLVITLVRLFFITLTLYFLRSKPFTKVRSKLQGLYEISYICILIPLVFPHQQHYAFFFIFPATTYLIFYTLFLFYQSDSLKTEKNFRKKKTALVSTLILIFLITSSHLILGQFGNHYDHFKIITYGVLLLIPLLALCRPAGIEDELKKQKAEI